MSIPALPAVVTKGRVVPVLTVDDLRTVADVGRGLLAGGIGCVEVTLRTPHAWAAVETLRRDVPDLVVGLGTVLTADQAARAAAVGAAFTVSPGFAPAATARATAEGIPSVPGIATPTEAMHAIAAGFELVKVFPASQLGGPAYLRTLASVFPDLRLMPSGGISAQNVGDYLGVPAVSAVSGSWMLPSDALATGDSARVAALSAEAIEAMASAE